MRPAFPFIIFGAFLAMTATEAHADAILTVGASGADYTTLSAAARFADHQSGFYYTIEIYPGTYVNDFSVVTVPMSIEAAGGGPVILDAMEPPTNHKAIITTSASTVIIGLTLENAQVSPSDGSNGAGIRDQAGTSSLVVMNSTFENNQDGILADADATNNVSISGSSFISDGFDAGSGACPSSGCDHAIYIGAVNSLNVTDSSFCGTHVGHDIKSRAAMTRITDNQLYDGAADSMINCPVGSTSYAIDLANGGAGRISGNQIIQGPNTENSIMIAYGEEGLVYAENSLLVSDNIFTSTGVSNAIGVYDPPCALVLLQNNTFQGVDTPVKSASCAEYVSQSVPEPSSCLVLLSGLVGYFAICAYRRAADSPVARAPRDGVAAVVRLSGRLSRRPITAWPAS